MTNTTQESDDSKEIPYISMLVYGVGGTGKSIFASTFPNALIIDADNGHKLYRNHFPQHTYVTGDQCIPALQKAVEQLQADGQIIDKSGNKIQTIVIDTLTNLENQAISGLKGIDVGNWGSHLYNGRGKKLTYDEWGSVSGTTIALLTHLRDLPINLVIITQVETKKDGDKLIPNLIGKGSDESVHFGDFTAYITLEKTAAGKKRLMYLSSTDDDKFVAKSRTLQGNVGPIENPSYDKIVDLLKDQTINLNFK